MRSTIRTIGLALSLLCGTMASAEPVDLEVFGPAGMSVNFEVLDADGVAINSTEPTEIPVNLVNSLYKTRITEGLPEEASSWCVSQLSSDPATGGEPRDALRICTDQISITAGTIVFPATGLDFNAFDQAGFEITDDGLKLTRLPALPNSVACVQMQLAAFGADAGEPDGVIGPKTEKALEDFVATAKAQGASFALPEFSKRSATIWCSALAQFPPAKPAFEMFVGKGRGFEVYFSNLILAPAAADDGTAAGIIGNVTVLRKGQTFAVRVSGSTMNEGFFTPAVEEGVDPTVLSEKVDEVLADSSVADLLSRGLTARGLSLEDDLRPAFADADTVLKGQIDWTEDNKRFDLLADFGDDKHAAYLVFVGKSFSEAGLLAFSVLDRQ